jgi:hypothetical protein
MKMLLGFHIEGFLSSAALSFNVNNAIDRFLSDVPIGSPRNVNTSHATRPRWKLGGAEFALRL